jgi:hypothetical protein
MQRIPEEKRVLNERSISPEVLLRSDPIRDATAIAEL